MELTHDLLAAGLLGAQRGTSVTTKPWHFMALTLRMRLHSRYQQAMPADIK